VKVVEEVQEVKEAQDVEKMSAILNVIFVGRGFNRDMSEVVFFRLY
jgi:predicted house-cleaning noncanonical NTP pyrophosphatase (MazG superfamily)